MSPSVTVIEMSGPLAAGPVALDAPVLVISRSSPGGSVSVNGHGAVTEIVRSSRTRPRHPAHRHAAQPDRHDQSPPYHARICRFIPPPHAPTSLLMRRSSWMPRRIPVSGWLYALAAVPTAVIGHVIQTDRMCRRSSALLVRAGYPPEKSNALAVLLIASPPRQPSAPSWSPDSRPLLRCRHRSRPPRTAEARTSRTPAVLVDLPVDYSQVPAAANVGHFCGLLTFGIEIPSARLPPWSMAATSSCTRRRRSPGCRSGCSSAWCRVAVAVTWMPSPVLPLTRCRPACCQSPDHDAGARRCCAPWRRGSVLLLAVAPSCDAVAGVAGDRAAADVVAGALDADTDRAAADGIEAHVVVVPGDLDPDLAGARWPARPSIS